MTIPRAHDEPDPDDDDRAMLAERPALARSRFTPPLPSRSFLGLILAGPKATPLRDAGATPRLTLFARYRLPVVARPEARLLDALTLTLVDAFTGERLSTRLGDPSPPAPMPVERAPESRTRGLVVGGAFTLDVARHLTLPARATTWCAHLRLDAATRSNLVLVRVVAPT